MASDWGHCEDCGGYGYLPHRCKLYEVCREGEDDWQEVYGVDQEDALERWADTDDCQGDYTIIQAGESGDLHMLIRDPKNPSAVSRFHVFGETVAKYHAREAPK